MAKRGTPKSVVYGAKTAAKKTSKGNRLYLHDADTLEHGARSARILATIRRDMDLKDVLMRRRRRNEEILSLAYQDGTMIGGEGEVANLRQNFLNLPYRYVRWLESQATSKTMVVKVNRDAGAGQVAGGPADSDTGMWVGIALTRVAYEAGFKRETKAVMREVCPLGTSVMRIGYHEQAITLAETAEVGKDAQSVIPEVLAQGDVEAKPGQAHAEISAGLANMVEDPMVQMTVGREGAAAILARKDSHDRADYEQETNTIPKESTRLLRHRLWMRKLRVGAECGWSPHVTDIEDAPMWWERFVWTVAEVKASDLFTEAFKKKAADYSYDGRNVSGVVRGGQTVATESMGSDARQAQSEDILDEDERMIEWFQCWFRRPEMKSGGIRKIVCAACPDEFIEADDSNPHVFTEGPQRGECAIPGFYPFYDFTPILSSLPVPEATCGIPLIAVGMTQAEKIGEYNRLRHESALRHSLRLYQKHPGLKDNKGLSNALKNGTDGYSYDCPPGALDSNGKMQEAIIPIQFTGNTQEIDRQAAREESDWVKVQGMPPAVLQGVGTAETATQDQQGIAAGERESGALIEYFESRTADVLAGLRGLMRANYDDEDWVRLLGEKGAAVMKAWQQGTVDEGDTIHVTYGANAQAKETVDRKQLMEAITLKASQIDPITGLPKYDLTEDIEELNRSFGLGKPKLSAENQDKLRQLAQIGAQALQMMQAAQQQQGTAGGAPPSNGQAPRAGPNPSEGEGPQEGTLFAGAQRGSIGANAGGQP